MHISAVELNHLYRHLISLHNPDFKFPGHQQKLTKKVIDKIAGWAGSFETPETFTTRKELQEIGNDPAKSKELYRLLIPMLKLAMDLGFVFYTFCCCTLITVQHSSLTRYSADGKDPFVIYTAKLPLIKKQLLFMDLLRNALKKLQKMNK